MITDYQVAARKIAGCLRWDPTHGSGGPENLAVIAAALRVVLGTGIVVGKLSTIYATEADLRQWLSSPQPQLDGRCPVDLIDMGEIDAVLRLVDQLNGGAYT